MIPRGSALTTDLWLNWQREHRQALAEHAHTGGDDGAPLSAAAFDPSGTLRVKQLTVSGTLMVNGQTLTQIADVAADQALRDLGPELASKLSSSGGGVGGDLKVQGKGQVSGALVVQGKVTIGPGDKAKELQVFGPRVLALGPTATNPQVQGGWWVYPELTLAFLLDRPHVLCATWSVLAQDSALAWALRGTGQEADLRGQTLNAGTYTVFARSPASSSPSTRFEGAVHVFLFPC